MNIIIGYLYSDLMNIYGDTGNIICLKKRAEWRGIKTEVKNISVGDNLEKGKIDIYFFGGGQDQAQEIVSRDLIESGKGRIIKEEATRGVPLLAICGGYQLLGQYYQPLTGTKLPGAGVFPAYTVAGDRRMIGNLVISSSQQTNNHLVGFENHSGKTYLQNGAQPLGKTVKGFGNNGKDKKEGCIYKNSIGSYMHGSLLPKNPHLADWLLQKALEVKYGKKIELQQLDDSLETLAHNYTVKKFH